MSNPASANPIATHVMPRKTASPLEGEVGAERRVGGDAAARKIVGFGRRRPHTPHPSTLRVADLPLKGGGDFSKDHR